MPALVDITGRTFGRLTVTARDGVLNGQAAWRCRCACGGETLARGCDLRRGHTTSCGCWRFEACRTHGLSYAPEYVSWQEAIFRCHVPQNNGYPLYGARGIVVCDRWRQSFAAFYDDMGPRPSPRHTLDRINADGPYAPDNCRWATPREQANNRRNNRWIAVQGERLTIAQASRKFSTSVSAIRYRLSVGQSAEEAVRACR